MTWMRKSLILVLALMLLLGAALPAATAASDRLVLLPRNAVWRYLDNGQDLGAHWSASVDSSAWKQGAAPLGFGDDISETDANVKLGTPVAFGADENNKFMTTYFAVPVAIPSLKEYKGVEVYVHVDDGAVVYLNGQEIFRRGIKDGEAVNFATGAKFKPKEETFVIPLENLPMVKEGENLLAVEVHQDGGDSSDLWFELGLTAVKSLEAAEMVDYTITALPNPDVQAGEVTRVTMNYGPDAATQMAFTWYTNQASVGSDLQVMPYADKADFAAAQTITGHFSRSTNAPEYLVHKAMATGLMPGQKYAFRVGDAKLDKWSQPGSFVTDNRDGVFTFINMADSQAKSEDEAKLSAETFAAARKTVADADFMLLNGDIVDTGMKEEQWGWVLDAARDTLGNLPFLAVSGNHEEDNQSFAEHFNLKAPDGALTASGIYYSLDYENAHFIFLNTNEDSRRYRNFTPAQVEWLKADAAAAKQRGAAWLIAVMHKGPYTTSNHATDDDIMLEGGVRPLVAPLFAQLGVDLVLQGHDHIYALSKPIDQKGTVVMPQLEAGEARGKNIQYLVNPQGVVYMIPNTAGPKVYYKNKTMLKDNPAYFELFLKADQHPAAQYATDPNEDRPPRSIIQNFVAIEVAKDKLSAVVYEIDRNKGTEPYVADTFGLLKK